MTTLTAATTQFCNCSFSSTSPFVADDQSHSRLGFRKSTSSVSGSQGSLGESGLPLWIWSKTMWAWGRRIVCSFSSGRDTGPLSSRDEEVSPSSSAPDLRTVEELGAGRDAGVEAFSLLQTRRFWIGTSVATLVALGGNLGGVTSAILNTNPEFSRNVRADLLLPVKGFKRCLETSNGFEILYPASWVGDQRLVYRAVERAEKERSLDLPPIRGEPNRPQRRSSDPIVAFGPPGTEGELNVSVVVAPVFPGFSFTFTQKMNPSLDKVYRKAEFWKQNLRSHPQTHIPGRTSRQGSG